MQPNIPNTGGAGGDGGNAGGTGQQQARSFTQAELDALFADRAKRASESAISDLLGKAGAKSTDELLAFLAEGKKLKEGQLSEMDKLKADLDAANKKADQAVADGQLALAKAKERLMKAAVIAEATSQGFRAEAVNDVWLIVDRAKIIEKDDDYQGVKEAVAEVAKLKPFWMAGSDKTPRGTPKPPDKQTGDDKKQPPARPTIRF